MNPPRGEHEGHEGNTEGHEGNTEGHEDSFVTSSFPFVTFVFALGFGFNAGGDSTGSDLLSRLDKSKPTLPPKLGVYSLPQKSRSATRLRFESGALPTVRRSH